MQKLLYRLSEARAALGCGNTKIYRLINAGALDARRMGSRTYVTAESLEKFVKSLASVKTPTMAGNERQRADRRARLNLENIHAQNADPMK